MGALDKILIFTIDRVWLADLLYIVNIHTLNRMIYAGSMYMYSS